MVRNRVKRRLRHAVRDRIDALLEQYAQGWTLDRMPAVVIEVPRGSFLKRGSTGRIDFISPLPCPYNYGAVPTLLGLEGDLLDALASGQLSASDVDTGATQAWSLQGTPSTTYGTMSVNASPRRRARVELSMASNAARCSTDCVNSSRSLISDNWWRALCCTIPSWLSCSAVSGPGSFALVLPLAGPGPWPARWQTSIPRRASCLPAAWCWPWRSWCRRS